MNDIWNYIKNELFSPIPDTQTYERKLADLAMGKTPEQQGISKLVASKDTPEEVKQMLRQSKYPSEQLQIEAQNYLKKRTPKESKDTVPQLVPLEQAKTNTLKVATIGDLLHVISQTMNPSQQSYPYEEGISTEYQNELNLRKTLQEPSPHDIGSIDGKYLKANNVDIPKGFSMGEHSRSFNRVQAGDNIKRLAELALLAKEKSLHQADIANYVTLKGIEQNERQLKQNELNLRLKALGSSSGDSVSNGMSITEAVESSNANNGDKMTFNAPAKFMNMLDVIEKEGNIGDIKADGSFTVKDNWTWNSNDSAMDLAKMVRRRLTTPIDMGNGEKVTYLDLIKDLPVKTQDNIFKQLQETMGKHIYNRSGMFTPDNYSDKTWEDVGDKDIQPILESIIELRTSMLNTHQRKPYDNRTTF